MRHSSKRLHDERRAIKPQKKARKEGSTLYNLRTFFSLPGIHHRPDRDNQHSEILPSGARGRPRGRKKVSGSQQQTQVRFTSGPRKRQRHTRAKTREKRGTRYKRNNKKRRAGLSTLPYSNPSRSVRSGCGRSGRRELSRLVPAWWRCGSFKRPRLSDPIAALFCTFSPSACAYVRDFLLPGQNPVSPGHTATQKN